MPAKHADEAPRRRASPRPKPPPTRSAKAATVRSRVRAEQRSRSPERSASQSSRPPATQHAPPPTAPGPCRGAAGAGRSRPPPRRPRRCGRASRRRRRSPPRPGTLSQPRHGRPDHCLLVASGDEDRQRFIHPPSQAVAAITGRASLGGLLGPVASGQQRIGEQGAECELPARRVDVVNGRETCPLERLDRATVCRSCARHRWPERRRRARPE